MSQRFSLKVDEMRQNEPAATGHEPEAGANDGDMYYPTYGNVRDICFVLLCGRMVSLNYAYLIAKDANAERTEIILAFTTHTVTVKGINLESVFFKIMGQQVRLLQCADERYNSISPDKAIVNSIDVSLNG